MSSFQEPVFTDGGRESASQHMPTPIPSNMTFRQGTGGGSDVHMNSRESTANAAENSATLPLLNNDTDDDWSSQGSSAGKERRLNNIVIKK